MSIINKSSRAFLSQVASGTETLFRIEAIKPKEWKKYFPIMEKHFIPYEPIGIGLGSTVEDMRKFIESGVKDCAQHGVSVAAIHAPTDEVVGVNLNKILIMEDRTTFTDVRVEEGESELVKITRTILAQLEEAYDAFADPEVDKVLELAFVAVDKKFSGHKLAQRMALEGVKLGIEKGCQALTAQATNGATATIFTRIGMKSVYTFDYNTFTYKGKNVLNTTAMGKGNQQAKYFYSRIPGHLIL